MNKKNNLIQKDTYFDALGIVIHNRGPVEDLLREESLMFRSKVHTPFHGRLEGNLTIGNGLL